MEGRKDCIQGGGALDVMEEEPSGAARAVLMQGGWDEECESWDFQVMREESSRAAAGDRSQGGWDEVCECGVCQVMNEELPGPRAEGRMQGGWDQLCERLMVLLERPFRNEPDWDYEAVPADFSDLKAAITARLGTEKDAAGVQNPAGPDGAVEAAVVDFSDVMAAVIARLGREKHASEFLDRAGPAGVPKPAVVDPMQTAPPQAVDASPLADEVVAVSGWPEVLVAAEDESPELAAGASQPPEVAAPADHVVQVMAWSMPVPSDGVVASPAEDKIAAQSDAVGSEVDAGAGAATPASGAGALGSTSGTARDAAKSAPASPKATVGSGAWLLGFGGCLPSNIAGKQTPARETCQGREGDSSHLPQWTEFESALIICSMSEAASAEDAPGKQTPCRKRLQGPELGSTSASKSRRVG